jgi:hypothetical protein
MICSFAHKQLYISLVVIIGLANCTIQPDAKLPVTARLIAKYQVLDEKISPRHTKCGDIVKEFLQSDPYTCSFKVQGLEFDIENKYVVDSAGHLQKFLTYLAEGPVIYSREELAVDSGFMRYMGLRNFHIALAGNVRSILDGKDTIAIERIFPVEKLILARSSAHIMSGRRFIYQYQE